MMASVVMRTSFPCRIINKILRGKGRGRVKERGRESTALIHSRFSSHIPVDMKYSPQQQQQQQKQRKSESDVTSIDATLSRTSRRPSSSIERKNSSVSSSTRATVCRSPSTGMFAWMRVFRFASMLHQVGC